MDDPVITAPAHPRPGQPEATETLRGVMTDLLELVNVMPVPAGQAEASARILDRLAEEITEAAAMLRAAQSESGDFPNED